MADTAAPRWGRIALVSAALLLSLWLGAADLVSDTAVHDYEIAVVLDAARLDPAAKGKQAWLKDLRIDGHPAGRDRVTAIGDWRDEAAGSSYQYIAEHPAHDTRLRLRGAAFAFTALQHPWSGRIDVRRDGALWDSLALYAPEGQELRVDLGQSSGLLQLLLTAGIGILGLLLLRPWRGGAALTIWLGALVGYVHLACWLHGPVGVTTDTPYYLVSTDALVHGSPHGFPPGYGIFIYLCAAFGGAPGLCVTLVQHALMVLLAVLLHRRFRALIGEPWAFLGALLGGLAYPTMFGAAAAMSECWTCFTMAACLLLAWSGDGRGSMWRAVAAGVAAGWATLSRVVPIAALGPVLLAMALLPWRRRNWLWAAATVGIAVAIPAFAVLQNGVRSGQWKLSTIVGRHLYNHFVYQQKLLDRDGPATRELLGYLGDRDPREMGHWDVGDLVPAPTPAAALHREQLFEHVAIEAARTASLPAHLAFTWGLTWRNLSLSSVDSMAVGDWGHGLQPDLSHQGPLGDPVRAEAMQVRGAQWDRWSWPLMSWLLLLALPCTWLLRRGRSQWLAWLWTVWIYMFASSAVEYELPRYHVAVSPMVAMLAVGTIGLGWQRLMGRQPAKVHGSSRVAAPVLTMEHD